MSEQVEIHALVGAYAIGAVDDLEATGFERHLAACPVCREDVRDFRETAVRLAEAVALTPPPGLRERSLRRVRETAQLRGGPVTPSSGDRRARAPWLVAAACALLAVGGGGLALHQDGARRDAEAQVVALEGIVGDPAARRVTGTASGGGAVTLVVSGSRAAVVTSALPGLDAAHAYQLWIVRPQGITSAGLGPAAAAAAGSWSRLVDGVRSGDTVAVSVEPSGGSRQPTTTPLVALKA